MPKEMISNTTKRSLIVCWLENIFYQRQIMKVCIDVCMVYVTSRCMINLARKNIVFERVDGNTQ